MQCGKAIGMNEMTANKMNSNLQGKEVGSITFSGAKREPKAKNHHTVGNLMKKRQLTAVCLSVSAIAQWVGPKLGAIDPTVGHHVVTLGHILGTSLNIRTSGRCPRAQ